MVFYEVCDSKFSISSVWARWKVQIVENIFLELCKAMKHFGLKVYLLGR